jgi:hypothetical protein
MKLYCGKYCGLQSYSWYYDTELGNENVLRKTSGLQRYPLYRDAEVGDEIILRKIFRTTEVSVILCHRSERSQIATHHATRHNTSIHNTLSTALQLSISQKAQGTLPEDGNVMPKHVGVTTHN